MIHSRRKAVDDLLGDKTAFTSRDNMGHAFTKLLPGCFESSDVEVRGKVLRDVAKSPTNDAYRTALAQYRSALAALGNVTHFELKTSTRLIVGSGEKGGLEFGMTFAHPYGVPLLPGSSLKGVAASYANKVGGVDWKRDKTKKGNMAVELFGGRDARGKHWAGIVGFLDAWWVPAGTPYCREIVTPHYNSYYGMDKNTKQKAAPHGMDNPVPFSFVAIEAGQKFLFALTGPADAREVAQQILTTALQQQGLGGKTRTGYGILKPEGI